MTPYLLVVQSPEKRVHGEEDADPEHGLDVGHEDLAEALGGVVQPVVPLLSRLAFLRESLL